MTSALNPMQELNFRAWANSEGVQPTDDMRRMWMNPQGFDTGGLIGDSGDGGAAFSYPYPLDPATLPAKGLDFLGDNTLEKMTQNIMAVYNAAAKQPWAMASGESWYGAARQWVEYMLKTTGSDMDIDRAMAITAQMSENADWMTNMMRFRAYLSGTLQHGKAPPEGRPSGTVTLSDDLYNQVMHIQDAEDPIAAMRGQKIWNFFQSIRRGNQANPEPITHGDQTFKDPVAMDRWAKRIAVGVSDQPDTMVTEKKSLFDLADSLSGRGEYPAPIGGSKWSKSFDLMADAYREAAKRLKIPASEVLQAITWVFEGPTKNDPTIQNFKESMQWQFPITDEDIAQQILDAKIENDAKAAAAGTDPEGFGFTYDITGETPTEGMAYAPDKATEFKIDAGQLSKEEIVKYIRQWPRMWLKGNHIGGWMDADGTLTLDVSRVGDVSTKTIAAAQKAQQDAVYDFKRGELVVGSTDKATDVYTAAGKPKDLLEQHLKTPVSPPELPPEPVPTPEPKPIPKGFKPMPERELFEGRGSGPGSAMAPPKTTTLGKIGRIAGPVLQVAGDALTAYGIVGQAAQEGIQEQLEQGHTYVQRGDVLGIPFGQAFQGPSAKAGDPSSGVVAKPITPQDIKPPAADPAPAGSYDVNQIPQATRDLAAKSGHPIPTLIGSAGAAPPPPQRPSWLGGGGVQLNEQVVVQHASGPPTYYTLKRTGPHSYESPETIPLGPGDSIYLNGKRVR